MYLETDAHWASEKWKKNRDYYIANLQWVASYLDVLRWSGNISDENCIDDLWIYSHVVY